MQPRVYYHFVRPDGMPTTESSAAVTPRLAYVFPVLAPSFIKAVVALHSNPKNFPYLRWTSPGTLTDALRTLTTRDAPNC